MKFKHFLLFAASILLVDSSPSIAIPRQFAAQPRVDGYDLTDAQSCQAVSQAVVTIYAGTEIGSGSIVSPAGLIITNHHVIKEIIQSAGKKKIYVKLANGSRYIGQLLKTDRVNDLALIQINSQSQLPTVRLASTDSVQSGQRVCAIGSPFGRAGVLSEGTLSRVKSNGDLQSNVLLNPGNSGGPLLNSRGEMIGINKAILESPAGKNTGISFATGIVIARNFIEQTRPGSLASPIAQTPPISTASGRAIPVPLPASRPTVSATTDPALVIEPSYSSAAVTPAQLATPTDPNLAIEPSYLANPTPSTSTPIPLTLPASGPQLGIRLDVSSLIVQQVQFGSPAATAGMKPGDRLVSINGDQLQSFDELQALLNSRPDSVVFTVLRSQQIATVRVNF